MYFLKLCPVSFSEMPTLLISQMTVFYSNYQLRTYNYRRTGKLAFAKILIILRQINFYKEPMLRPNLVKETKDGLFSSASILLIAGGSILQNNLHT